MFKKNETIFYQKSGICEIVDICEKKITNTSKMYYVLSPIHDTRSMIYVPCDSDLLTGQMKKLLSKEELETIIQKVPTLPSIWIEDRNIRKEKFQEVLHHGNCLEVITLLKTIKEKKVELASKKKKLSSNDDAIYREAEKTVIETFSYILNIPKDEVITTIFPA